MKTIIFLVLFACSSICRAQTAIATANGVTARATTSTSSTQTKTTNVSVSVQNSDDSYSLNAKFDSYKKARIQKLLLENLDKEYLSKKGETLTWKKTDNDEIVYSVILSSEKLKINVDKDFVSNATVEKFQSLGEKISEVLRNE